MTENTRNSSTLQMTHPRVGKIRLWLSLWASDWRPGILVALLVFGLAFMTTLAPRAVDAMFSEELRYATGETLVEAQRVVSARVANAPHYGVGSNKDMQRFLNGTKEEAEEPLKSMLGEGQSLSFDQEKQLTPLKDMGPTLQTRLVFGVDPFIDGRISLTSGRMPEQSDELYYENVYLLSPVGFGGDEAFWNRVDAAQQRPIEERESLELLMHEKIAEQMDWLPGEYRMLGNIRVEVVGTYVESDPDDLYWKFAPNATAASYFNDYNGTEYYTALSYIDPDVWGYIAQGSVQTVAWYPFDTGTLDTSQAEPLLTALDTFLGKSYTLIDPATTQVLTVNFQSEVRDRLADVMMRTQNVGALFSMITVGPLVAGMLVLVLANRLMMYRRRGHLALLAARGMTLKQQRALHIVEGATVALFPALLGALLAAYIFGGPRMWGILPLPNLFDILVVFGLTVIYALMLALAVKRYRLTEEREDLGRHKKNPVRNLLELIVVLFAAAGLYLFLNRGFTLIPGLGVDPILALLPVLLLTALTIVALRIYPLPLYALHRRKRSSRQLAGFLGSLRAIREGAGGLLPLLAMTLTLSVAIFSVLMLSTLREAGERQAWLDVGADVQIRGSAVIGQTDALRNLDSVEAVALLGNAGRASVQTGSSDFGVSAIYADFEALAAVQGDTRWSLPVARVDGTASTPAVFMGSAVRIGSGQDIKLNSLPVQVVEQAQQLAGFPKLNYWVLVDESQAENIQVPVAYDLALIRLQDGVDVTAAVQEMQDLFDTTVTITTPNLMLAEIDGQPTVIGLKVAFALVALLSGILAVGSLLLFSLTIAPSRSRLFPLLASLGLRSGERRSLLRWEIVPLAVAAILSSALAGFGLAWLMVTVLDLSGFTGGTKHPPLILDPILLSGVFLFFVAGIVLTILVNAAHMKRLDLSRVLRT